jgi:hypothetical protein
MIRIGQTGLYRRVRGIMKERNLALALALTFILALFVTSSSWPVQPVSGHLHQEPGDRNEPCSEILHALYNIIMCSRCSSSWSFSFYNGALQEKESQARALKFISAPHAGLGCCCFSGPGSDKIGTAIYSPYNIALSIRIPGAPVAALNS